MKNWVEKANVEIVGVLSGGGRVVYGNVGGFYVVTCEPFHVAHIFKENQIYFSLDKAKKNVDFEKTFSELLDIERTRNDKNRIAATGAYYSCDGKSFIKEYDNDRGTLWLNTKLLKGLEFTGLYVESEETSKKDFSASPVLAICDGEPVRIILPTRKF